MRDAETIELNGAQRLGQILQAPTVQLPAVANT
jgi:hypothetical protein